MLLRWFMISRLVFWVGAGAVQVLWFVNVPHRHVIKPGIFDERTRQDQIGAEHHHALRAEGGPLHRCMGCHNGRQIRVGFFEPAIDETG